MCVGGLLALLPQAPSSRCLLNIQMRYFDYDEQACLDSNPGRLFSFYSKLSQLETVGGSLLLNFQLNFADLAGKVVLIENTASLWGTTVRDFTQMNQLSEKYGDKLVSKLMHGYGLVYFVA